jgi:hypothetical protein
VGAGGLMRSPLRSLHHRAARVRLLVLQQAFVPADREGVYSNYYSASARTSWSWFIHSAPAFSPCVRAVVVQVSLEAVDGILRPAALTGAAHTYGLGNQLLELVGGHVALRRLRVGCGEGFRGVREVAGPDRCDNDSSMVAQLQHVKLRLLPVPLTLRHVGHLRSFTPAASSRSASSSQTVCPQGTSVTGCIITSRQMTHLARSFTLPSTRWSSGTRLSSSSSTHSPAKAAVVVASRADFLVRGMFDGLQMQTRRPVGGKRRPQPKLTTLEVETSKW